MKIARGEFLYRTGEPSDSLFIIRSGRVALYSVQGLEHIELARFGPGQIIGDLAFFTGSARTADAAALTDVEYLQVPYTTVARQFDSVPSWVQTMIRTLAGQVQSYSTEVRSLKDQEDGVDLPRLVVSRAFAALALVPAQFGRRNGRSVTIDWSTLRTHSNLCFREVSISVMKVAKILETLGLCQVLLDENGQTELTLPDPDLIARFVKYYVRAISKDSPELTKIEPIEYDTLQLLSRPELKAIPIHRGLVEIDLVQFTEFAKECGHPEISAVSTDLLTGFGIGIQKIASETSVKLRFHQQDIRDLGNFWRIIQAIHRANQPQPRLTAA